MNQYILIGPQLNLEKKKQGKRLAKRLATHHTLLLVRRADIRHTLHLTNRELFSWAAVEWQGQVNY